MNLVKFMSIVLAMSIALITTQAHAMSIPEVIGQTTSVKVEAPQGGIRDIIIFPLTIIILQEYSLPLNVTMYDSKGKTVYNSSTENLETTIETSAFPSGDYQVVTLAEGESKSQNFEVSL